MNFPKFPTDIILDRFCISGTRYQVTIDHKDPLFKEWIVSVYIYAAKQYRRLIQIADLKYTCARSVFNISVDLKYFNDPQGFGEFLRSELYLAGADVLSDSSHLEGLWSNHFDIVEKMKSPQCKEIFSIKAVIVPGLGLNEDSGIQFSFRENAHHKNADTILEYFGPLLSKRYTHPLSKPRDFANSQLRLMYLNDFEHHGSDVVYSVPAMFTLLDRLQREIL